MTTDADIQTIREALFAAPRGPAMNLAPILGSPIGEAGGGSWDRSGSGRPRVDLHPLQEKLRWELHA